MQKGVVSWFNVTKGYGFIRPEGGGKDVFVHYKEIKADGFRVLSEGDKVEYTIAQNDKGPQAINVLVIED